MLYCIHVWQSGRAGDRRETDMTINELAATALAAVTARGYRNCDDTQFIARNLCKATEELGECCDPIFTHRDMADPTVPLPAFGRVDQWACDVSYSATSARFAFDAWGDGVHGIDADVIRAELPDVLIPLLCAAAVLGVDVEAAVLAKAGADVARGVRA